MGKTDWFGKQAELMRELYRKYNGDRDHCVEEFAAAGERGEIVRKSNTAQLSRDLGTESSAPVVFFEDIRADIERTLPVDQEVEALTTGGDAGAATTT